jgi:membrane protease YdiL (CAAX protease family)
MKVRSIGGIVLQDSSRENPIPPSRNGTDLTKVALSLVVVFFAYWLFLRFEGVFLARQWNQSADAPLNRYFQLTGVSYPLRAFFLLLEMLLVVWLFRPVSQLVKHGSKAGGRTGRLAYDVGVGIAGGLAGFVVTIPFLWGVRATPFITGLVTQDRSIGLKGLLTIALITLFVPLGIEFVFRAILQGRLTAHMTPTAAILVSAVLGASLWSLFNFPFSMALGLICGALFWWRGTLLPAVVADAVMTLSAAVYVGLRVWS